MDCESTKITFNVFTWRELFRSPPSYEFAESIGLKLLRIFKGYYVYCEIIDRRKWLLSALKYNIGKNLKSSK